MNFFKSRIKKEKNGVNPKKEDEWNTHQKRIKNNKNGKREMISKHKIREN